MKATKGVLTGFITILSFLFFISPLPVIAEEGPGSPASESATGVAPPAGEAEAGEATIAPSRTEEEATPALEDLIPEEKLLPLSLRESLCLALANSLDIQIEGYLPRISAADIVAQKGAFDPHLFFSALYINSMIPLPSSASVQTGGLSAVELEQWTLSGGLTGAIPSGLFYEAIITSDHTPHSTITEAFGTEGEQRFETVLTVSQPLLKNFGIDVNTTGIRAAEKANDAAVYQLEQSVIDILFAVEQAYWNLVFAYENLRVRLNSLRLAQNLLHENRIRLRVGVVAPLDVLQSETGVATREEEVILALSLVERASDQLISLMNLFPGQNNWNVHIYPIDSVIAGPPVEHAEGEEIGLALRERPDLSALILQREIAGLQAKFAKNQLLPALNLNASAGWIGLDSEFNSSFLTATPVPPFPHTGVDRAWDNLVSGDAFQWMLGFTFEMPLGQNSERGQYRSATLQVNQLDTIIQNTRLLIIQDIRNALRQIQSNWELVQTSKVTADYRKRYLEAERKRYEVGVTTTFDLLRYENDLAQAQAIEINSQVQYRISLANLNRATGMLLDHLGIQMDVDP
jgi:outer membrane protein TolC